MPTWNEAAARAVIAREAAKEGALLVALHALLGHFGYVDRRTIPLLADAFNLSRAEVTGVVSFYKDFRNQPPGRHVVKLCGAEACQAVGGEALAEAVRARLGPDVTVETVYCLGNCALGPAALVDGRLEGRVDAERLCAGLWR